MTANIFSLPGHVALITGGNAGLGLAMARGLVNAGAHVAIWGRSQEKNDAAVAELEAIGGKAVGFICDVTDADACKKAFEETIAEFDRIDSCFANAGGSGARGPFHTLSAKDWQMTLDINVMSVITTSQLAIQHWLEREAPGKLAVTSSVAGMLGLAGASGYSLTKAAVEGLVRALAIEYGAAGITVNAIVPGFVETEMSLNTPQYFQDGCKRRAASGQIGQLEDFEGIAVYLASEKSRFLTGQSLVLDGGHTIFPL